MTASAGSRLKALLAKPGIVVAPGVPDALTAKLVEEAGFAAVYLTGGGIARGRGFPDLGYTTLTEMAERAANITEVCPLPAIVDVDSGFGNVLTLCRAVRSFERIGAAGLHVEDMEIPHRRKDPRANLVDAKDIAGRIRAALRARSDADFLIIARTDAVPALGLDEAIERGNRYADAGAGMVYIEHLRTRAQMEAVARRVAAPKLISLNKGLNELLPATALAEMGYKLLTHPADAQLAAIAAMRALLKHLKQHGSTTGFEAMATFAERDKLVGTEAARALEDEYLP